MLVTAILMTYGPSISLRHAMFLILEEITENRM